jgi:hypothetical protein
MPEDKRPRPIINMTVDPADKAPPRLELPGGNGGPGERNAWQKPASATEAAPKRRGRSGFFSHLLASMFGGAIVAGGVYLALMQEIPGFSLIDPGTRRQIQKLQDRTTDLDRAMRAETRSAAAYPPAGSEGQNEVRARLDGIVSATRDLDAAMQSLSQKVQTLEGRGGNGIPKEALQAEVAGQIAPLSQRLASIERDIEALTRTQNERQVDARSAALTLALTNLKRAIGDGRTFSAELSAVENLSTTKLPVSQLASYKDIGVLSLAQLQRDFSDSARKAIEKHYQSKSGSIMGELISRTKAAIQVRPTESTGDTVEAILGRMETALKAGNLKGALTEGAALNGSAQEEMQAWLAQAQARVTVDDAIRKTDQELLAYLTRAPSRRQ